MEATAMISSKFMVMSSFVIVIIMVHIRFVGGVPNTQLMFYTCGSNQGFTPDFVDVRDAVNGYIILTTLF